jgi:bifunctional DNase/RNase
MVANEPAGFPGATAFDIAFTFYDEARGTFMICLHELGGSRRLCFTTGYPEGVGLDRALRRLASPRPLTYTLVGRIVTELGGRLARVVVDNHVERDHLYHSKLHIAQADRTLVIDARPSDALVLAVTLCAPLFITNEVLAKLRWNDERVAN